MGRGLMGGGLFILLHLAGCVVVAGVMLGLGWLLHKLIDG
jgi:hypothetical protein